LRSLIKRYRHNAAGGRAPRIKLIEDLKGGNSISVGSRTSERYYRGYDKTREQQGRVDGWLFRHELELKGTRAVQAWDQYKKTDRAEELSLRMVSSHLKTLGIREKWMQEVPALLMPTTRTLNDNERRLQWIKIYVTRVFHALIEAGLQKELEEVLQVRFEAKK
jgi:DNA relaxase NicK